MYTHFYGFTEEPFRDTPDLRFLFAVPGHERALNCLRQGTEEKNGWILLSGEPGSGKTILVRHLLRNLQEKPGLKSVYTFQTRISFEDLLKEILSELNLSPTPAAGASIAEHFSRSVSQLLTPAGTLALFLDEAQNIGVEVLEKIGHFFGKEYPHPEQVQFIFSGQTPLEEKLQSQELRLLHQRIRHRCQIKPLADGEARRYIEHRLHLAGGNADVFTPEALNLIIRYGEGIPRTLNIICDNVLRLGHQISEPRISGEIVRKAFREMYIQAGHPHVSGKATLKTPLVKKILYSLAAILGLLAVVLLAGEYSQKGKRSLNAEAGATPERAGREEPSPPQTKPEEKPPQETEGEPPLPAKQDDSAPPEHPVLPAGAVFKEPKAMAAEVKVKKIISVKAGATLSSLCWENYGFTNITLLDQILVLNPELTNPGLILVNQKILLPDIREELLAREKSNGIFQVFLGTFPCPDIARTFSQQSLLKGKEIETAPRKLATGETWHRLSAGMFASKEEALTTIRALQKKGLLPAFGGDPQKKR